MSNGKTPESYDSIVQHLEDAADGAAAHGVAIHLAQNTEAAIRQDLTRLIGSPAGPGGVPAAVPGLKADWNTAKANKTAKTAALRSVLSDSRALCMACIGTLKIALGRQWNSQWNAVGFTDASLEVPRDPMVKLQQLRAYYAANPTREVANVNGLACTAAACEAAVQDISDAQTASNDSNRAAGQAKAALELGIAAGRNRLIGLRGELGQLLADDDPRWLAFGFEMPGATHAPDVPGNLIATPGAAGSAQLFFDWDDARGADRYRLTLTDAAGTVVWEEIVYESEHMVTGLTAGTVVRATVSGRNAAGNESQPCPPITVTVP